ncbi:Hypothetical protein R9X50_00043100 [Acrodontium crateriforme]|uniref:Thioredoxin n=1 Tax=Acrodontium crateriforme TaxID=150365 RepID=A0AAQ3LY24_9PEZI|nr:Hypothetical protein R9X50_00043100 [Acrodontium crateriforme]
MSHTVLNNKADFDKALETKDKNVFIYIHDGGELPESAKNGAAKFEATSAAFSVDAAVEPKVKDYFQVSELPAAVIYKDGKELKKFEGLNQEHMGEIGSILSV